MHFSLRDDNLVVRAQCNQTSDILALIPSSKLRGDLPPALVDGHVHWLNLTTRIIEIRPVEQLWEHSSDNWMIHCASGQYRMYRGCETLVDIRSPTWAMVFECFKCLCNVDRTRWIRAAFNDGYEYLQSQSRNILITAFRIQSSQSASMQRLSVTLPHYSLSFNVNERQELESRDFKDMVYDENQCLGTLIGLENLLVLRPKTRAMGTPVPDALIPRCFIVPNGFPKSHHDHQIRINAIDPDFFFGSNEPFYYVYEVDTELGCLVGNGSLKSTRYLAYLHAATSCHRPDPLTCKMGAQAALDLLESAGCRSFMKLKAFDSGDGWTSIQYPQINAAYREIQARYYWNYHDSRHVDAITAVEKHGAQRASYLFLSNAAPPISLEDDGESKYLTTRIAANLD